jgi:hypothetical protein
MHLLANERVGGLKSELILCLSLQHAETETINIDIVDLFQDRQSSGREYNHSQVYERTPLSSRLVSF